MADLYLPSIMFTLSLYVLTVSEVSARVMFRLVSNRITPSLSMMKPSTSMVSFELLRSTVMNVSLASTVPPTPPPPAPSIPPAAPPPVPPAPPPCEDYTIVFIRADRLSTMLVK